MHRACPRRRLVLNTLLWFVPSVVSWPMMGFDATHNHKDRSFVEAPHTVTPIIKWKYNHNGGEVESSPVLSPDEGIAFAASERDIFAVDAKTGKKKWSHKVNGPVLASGTVADGAFFIGSDDKNFYALEQDTGKVRWIYSTGGEFTGGATATKVAETGQELILVGTGGPIEGKNHGGTLIAFLPKSNNEKGEVKWAVGTVGMVCSTPASDGAHAFFGDDAGTFYKVSLLDGKVVWKTKARYGIRCPAAIHTDTVYFSAGDPDSKQAGQIIKLEKGSGKVIWDSQCEKNNCESCWTTPTLMGEKVVLGCGLDSRGTGKLWGLNDADGTVAWKKNMPNDVQTSSPVPQKDGTFLIGSIDGGLYNVNATTGDIIFTWMARKGIWATTAIGRDGTLFVGSHDGNLYALGYGQGKDDL